MPTARTLKQVIQFPYRLPCNDTIDQSKSTVQILNLNANVGTSGLNTIETSVTIPTDMHCG